tara:strand:+ start:2327 stop:2920 length:594 start_codon:yes stop_codon:yes gene_type:complete
MYVIAITGGTGSGKTTLVQSIINKSSNKEISYLSSDYYYKHNPELSFLEREKINYDEPKAIDFNLLKQHICDLREGKSINVPKYCFKTHLRKKDYSLTIPKKTLLIEGILILSNPELRKEFNLKIFLECNRYTRLKRRVFRDIYHRGRNENDVIDLFNKRLDSMHKKYVIPVKKYCDIVVNTEKDINYNDLIKKIYM